MSYRVRMTCRYPERRVFVCFEQRDFRAASSGVDAYVSHHFEMAIIEVAIMAIIEVAIIEVQWKELWKEAAMDGTTVRSRDLDLVN